MKQLKPGMRQARKGDLALVLRAPNDGDYFVGEIVRVITDPYTAPAHWKHGGNLVNDIVSARFYALTNYLIPLDGDPDRAERERKEERV